MEVRRTIFLYCSECNNIFLSNNRAETPKELVCGRGCDVLLGEITKAEACKIALENKNG